MFISINSMKTTELIEAIVSTYQIKLVDAKIGNKIFYWDDCENGIMFRFSFRDSETYLYLCFCKNLKAIRVCHKEQPNYTNISVDIAVEQVY